MHRYSELPPVYICLFAFGILSVGARYFLSKIHNEPFEGIGPHEKVFYLVSIILMLIEMVFKV